MQEYEAEMANSKEERKPETAPPQEMQGQASSSPTGGGGGQEQAGQSGEGDAQVLRSLHACKQYVAALTLSDSLQSP